MFYLSNSSMALFPENTLLDYTTKLRRDFALVGSWEAALSEIMYPATWHNIADGREYYVKVGVPNEADLKIHLKTDYYKYPEDILFQLVRSLDRKLKKRPLRTFCLTASILGKLRSTLQCPSSTTGLVKNSDDCSALKLVTSINQGCSQPVTWRHSSRFVRHQHLLRLAGVSRCRRCTCPLLSIVPVEG